VIEVMKRIIEALKAKLARPKDLIVDDQSSHTVSADDVPTPDIYADEHVDTVPNLEVADPSVADADKTTKFDLDDTARMHKK
jgi:hypothetical protein